MWRINFKLGVQNHAVSHCPQEPNDSLPIPYIEKKTLYMYKITIFLIIYINSLFVRDIGTYRYKYRKYKDF